LALDLEDGSSLEADRILVAIGRVPNVKRLELDKAGVEVDMKGYVKVDEY
jgi:pyruvate/2-oxoglutarate dehydrogenase complex dihydrolipoamide dehydrogenase (E3) component